MKYCLIGLVCMVSISISPTTSDNLNNSSINLSNETLDLGRTQDSELYAWICLTWGCDP